MEPFLEEHLRLRQGPEAEMCCPYIRGGPLFGALALAHLGEVQRARAVAASVAPDFEVPGLAETLCGRLATELGDAGTGRQFAERLVRIGRRPGPENIPTESIALVEALEAQGDWGAVAGFLPAARSQAGFLAAMTPTCDRAEGLMRAAAGAREDAILLLERAIDGFDRLSLPLQAARARERLARVQPERATGLLRSALEVYSELGAALDARRARSAPGA